MIGVAGRDDLDAIQSFIATRGVGEFQHIADESGDVWTEFEVRSQPAYVFINDDGTISDPTGTLSEDELRERLTALVES